MPGCGNAARRSARTVSDPKALLLNGLSRRFRRFADDHRRAHQSGLCRHLYVPPGRRLRRAVSGFLDRMPNGGVIMCHPGKVDAELKRLDPVTDLREREYAFFASDAFLRLLAEQGVTL